MLKNQQPGPSRWHSSIRIGLGQRKSALTDAEIERLAGTLERLSEAAATASSARQAEDKKPTKPEVFAEVLQALSND